MKLIYRYINSIEFTNTTKIQFLLLIFLVLNFRCIGQDPSLSSPMNNPNPIEVSDTTLFSFSFENNDPTISLPIGAVSIFIQLDVAHLTACLPISSGDVLFLWGDIGNGTWAGINTTPIGSVSSGQNGGQVEMKIIPFSAGIVDNTVILQYAGDTNLDNNSLSEPLNIAPIGTLAVDLLSFDLKRLNNEIHLNWVTASETNHDYFKVMHSHDGVQFTPIGIINAKGSENRGARYDFIHSFPNNGINYYKLIDVEFSEKESHSDIKAIRFETPLEYEVFPNPTSDYIHLNTGENSNDTHLVKIFDELGRLVFKQTKTMDDPLKLDVSSWSNGLYNILLEPSNAPSSNIRFLKIDE